MVEKTHEKYHHLHSVKAPADDDASQRRQGPTVFVNIGLMSETRLTPTA